jgi:hypothetical protein
MKECWVLWTFDTDDLRVEQFTFETDGELAAFCLGLESLDADCELHTTFFDSEEQAKAYARDIYECEVECE